MKKIVFLILIIFILSWLELPRSSAQTPPWGDIPIPTPGEHKHKGKEKGKAKIPGKGETEKRIRIYKDYKTRQLEYQQFYSTFIINDRIIDKEERFFLDLKKAELELSADEVESIEFLVKLESPAVLQKD